MYIKSVHIENYKSYKGCFDISLNDGINILVGNNEAGKSTLIEAIHLALTGILNGRYLKNELSQYLFNNDIVNEYLDNLKNGRPASLPHILIELYIGGDDCPLFCGNANSHREDDCGLSYKITFDERYRDVYEELIKQDVKTLPIEYYDVVWTSFARDGSITSRNIPLKSALIDSSNTRYQNGSDVYISRIVKECLEPKEIVDITQAYRKMQEVFMGEESIGNINTRLKGASRISNKDVELSVDLSSKNAWENCLMTYLDKIPFNYIGKGEQCIVKTKLALAHKKAKEASIILMEEPENHLSYSKLNELIAAIKEHCKEKQIIISTHSSFVANKLGLKSLILLHDRKTLRLHDLSPSTIDYFEKLSGYDTLRLLLCQKAILVEGDSDELVVQKAYLKKYGKLPIEDGVDVIAVGNLSFLRFLEIAKYLTIQVTVVTDNDGNIDALNEKYKEYKDLPNICICFDDTIDAGDLRIGDKPFNYNTMEPKIVKANSLDKMNIIMGTAYENIDDFHKYMKAHKTDCALAIFNTTEELVFPEYINKAIL